MIKACSTYLLLFVFSADGEYVVTTMTKAILHFDGHVKWYEELIGSCTESKTFLTFFSIPNEGILRQFSSPTVKSTSNGSHSIPKHVS